MARLTLNSTACQIALESGANVLRMLFGGTDDDDDEDDFKDMKDDDIFPGEGGCGSDQQPPPPVDLVEIDQVEEVRLLEMQSEPDLESKPALELGTDNNARKPKLAINGDTNRLAGRRDENVRNRMYGFQTRESRRSGSGQLLSGGSSGFAGFIG